jgi:hypothetical protein
MELSYDYANNTSMGMEMTSKEEAVQQKMPIDTIANGKKYLEAVFQEQSEHLDPITHFRKITSPDNPRLALLMSSLVGEVTPQQFSEFCNAFADGAEYVREKYGTQPAAICITDQKDEWTYCSFDTLTVHVTRQFIAEIIRRGSARIGKADPFVLDPRQAAFVAGVEEAFHAHQFKSNPDRYDALSREQEKTGIKPGDKGYNDLPIESEARDVVRQAMIDTGIVYTAPVGVSNLRPEDMEWAKEFIKLRATPSPATPTTHIDMAQLQQRINDVREKETVSFVIR